MDKLPLGLPWDPAASYYRLSSLYPEFLSTSNSITSSCLPLHQDPCPRELEPHRVVSWFQEVVSKLKAGEIAPLEPRGEWGRGE